MLKFASPILGIPGIDAHLCKLFQLSGFSLVPKDNEALSQMSVQFQAIIYAIMGDMPKDLTLLENRDFRDTWNKANTIISNSLDKDEGALDEYEALDEDEEEGLDEEAKAALRKEDALERKAEAAHRKEAALKELYELLAQLKREVKEYNTSNCKAVPLKAQWS